MPSHNASDTPESGPRFRALFGEIWHDWLEAISDVAYQTHRACEYLSENSDPSNLRHGPFDPYWRAQAEGANGSIDMKKLEECLRSMELDAGVTSYSRCSDYAGHGSDTAKTRIARE